MALSVLNGIFSAAHADRIVAHNPAQNLRRPAATPPVEKRALTDEERIRVRSVFTSHQHGHYLATMYYTGMRPGEVLGLQWGDFDWAGDLIHVQRDIDYASKSGRVGALKTRAADRYIPISSELKSLLQPRAAAPGMFLFTGADPDKPLSLASAERIWIDLMMTCNMGEAIPAEESKYRQKDDIRGRFKPSLTPHAIRHNFITICWEHGMDELLTMKIVGHTDYQTTRNIYTHLNKKHLDNAKLKMDEMFR